MLFSSFLPKEIFKYYDCDKFKRTDTHKTEDSAHSRFGNTEFSEKRKRGNKHNRKIYGAKILWRTVLQKQYRRENQR